MAMFAHRRGAAFVSLRGSATDLAGNRGEGPARPRLRSAVIAMATVGLLGEPFSARLAAAATLVVLGLGLGLR